MTEGYVYTYAQMLDFPFFENYKLGTSVYFFLVPLILHFFCVCVILSKFAYSAKLGNV